MSSIIDKYVHPAINAQQAISYHMHKTKIVATVGPSCDTYEKLLDLVQAGVNVFRLNFSHGNHEDKALVIKQIRRISEIHPFNIAILGDLQGPKLRVGEIENNMLPLHKNQILTFTNQKCVGNAERIYVSYPNLAKDVKIGDAILIDDGKIEVIVSSITPNGDVLVEVTTGGILSSKKGINLPDTEISLPALTTKDLEDLDFIIKMQLDWVALSFVRKPADLLELRKILKAKASKTKVISKIEKPEAIVNIKAIIDLSDAIMIARGDLGVEMPVEKVPLIQRDIIKQCLHRAKPVIVATQMMESMIDRIKPNRSETSDVANAVLEGADAVMLSGETATGMHPALVVETMRKIILEVEKQAYRYDRENELKPQPDSPTLLSDAICHNACKLAYEVRASAIIGMTQSGYTAFTLSSYRPHAPLYVFSKERSLISQLCLCWGVRAFYYDEEQSLDAIINDQISFLKKRNFIKLEDVVVNTGSTPVDLHLPTNIIKITKVE